MPPSSRASSATWARNSAPPPPGLKLTLDFLPAITDPGKVICIGVNYRSHQNETGNAAHQKEQKAPTIFTRFADSQMGHLQPALMPATTNEFDYEGEMALVIGKQAWHVPEEEAFDYVAGYGAYNDFSVRDWQLAATPVDLWQELPGHRRLRPISGSSCRFGRRRQAHPGNPR